MKATGALFGFLSFRSWETSTVKGPGWEIGQQVAFLVADRKFEIARADVRRKPSSWGSISTDMVVMLGTGADGGFADAVAWPFNDRSGSERGWVD